MPINESTFEYVADNLIKEFNRCKKGNLKPEEFLLERMIYDALSWRKSPEDINTLYKKYFKVYENEYYNHLFNKLVFGDTAQLDQGSQYFQVSCNIRPGSFMQRSRIGVFKILYKEYFTFSPKSKSNVEILEEIREFLNALPELHNKLYEVSIKHFDKIDFKVPENIHMLMRQPDSLVIYYRNKVLSQLIRTTTKDVFGRHGITLGARNIRTESGFDFYSDQFNKSHSELIARVLAKDIVQKYQKFFWITKKDLIVWLKKSIKEVNKWDETQVHKFVW